MIFGGCEDLPFSGRPSVHVRAQQPKTFLRSSADCSPRADHSSHLPADDITDPLHADPLRTYSIELADSSALCHSGDFVPTRVMCC